MLKRFMTLLVALAAVAAVGWAAWNYLARPDSERSTKAAPAPTSVEATTASATTWQARIQGTGELAAVQGIEVKSEVQGRIAEIYFEAGNEVDAGDPLLKIDDSRERAGLASLRAQEQRAQAEYDRVRYLETRDVSTAARLDEATAELKRLEAEIEAQQAVLSKRTIVAPFGGKLGIRKVSLGQLLSPGDPIVELQSVEALFLNFALPGRYYGDLSPGLTVHITVASAGDQVFECRVASVAPSVERTTRNFIAQARCENPQRLLAPGMFAQVTILKDDRRDVVVLPTTAVSYNPYGDAVFTLHANEPNAAKQGLSGQFTAKRVFVEIGETRGTQVEILKGIEGGQLVVSAGHSKLHDGATVVVDRDADQRPADVTISSSAPQKPGRGTN